jgi:geranylgeranyl diphosphate synthase, type II
VNFEVYHQTRSQRIEQFLTTILKENVNLSHPNKLIEAMQYSVLNGGKRIRPLLVYATAEALGCPLEKVDTSAAAVELIHCYSLIHDDLPAMDNDDLRRGKPTCHRVFGEATAILAGDALQTLAFQILVDPTLTSLSAEQMIRMTQVLTKKSGINGMVGGQALDIETERLDHPVSFKQLSTIHQKKTGALIEASVLLGAIASGCTDQKVLDKLEEYARTIGLAFQIQDDILDKVGDPNTLGKNVMKDQKQNKTNFPGLLGLDEAKLYADQLQKKALESIGFLKEKASHLENLSIFFVNRIV